MSAYFFPMVYGHGDAVAIIPFNILGPKPSALTPYTLELIQPESP